MSEASCNQIGSFAPIGDLHLTDAKQRDFVDYPAIVAQIEMELSEGLDFIVLPGENADNGLPAQYRLVATGLKMLSNPVPIIPGDHDMEQGGLEAFYDMLGAPALPRALTVRRTRSLFLDISGPGRGGPDFRLGGEQLTWLEHELNDPKSRSENAILFMHTDPHDLKGDGETHAVIALIAAHDMPLVGIGHTHYNEPANDGRTIYAATRSTGQIEEGPVGFSVATLDAGIISGRFNPLEDAFPFVLITAPAGHRLMRGASQAANGTCDVRALILGSRELQADTFQVEEGEWTAMSRSPDGRLWTATVALPADRLISITVKAVDKSGRPGQNIIRAATQSYVPPVRARSGNDADAIRAWPENGIFGTQLGPKRNARPSANPPQKIIAT